MTAPGDLQINAWIDESTGPVVGGPSPVLADWSIRKSGTLVPITTLFADEVPDEREWRDKRVGWGLVLPDDDSVDAKKKAAAKDAPDPIQELLAARPGSSVLRYRPELGAAHLMHYDHDGTGRKLATAGGEPGRDAKRVPKYLLIVASPKEIPWRLQYMLNPLYYVGRLDLPEAGLRSYVDALLTDWKGFRASRRSVLIWTVDKGSHDITWTMRHGLAEPLRRKFSDDPDVRRLRHLAQDEATHDALMAALTEEARGLVVTTSHGATPIDLDADSLRAALGRPVDQAGDWLTPAVLGDWQPEGAVWYAHACCSAGADAETLYTDVADKTSDVQRVLDGVTAAGSCTAPLPRHLLGCERPLRAFVGHVEPTFNWTLQDPVTKQLLTSSLRLALYDGLFQQRGEPVGLALHRAFQEVGGLWSRWAMERESAVGGNRSARPRALGARLTALDRQSTVILGDPTVTVCQD